MITAEEARNLKPTMDATSAILDIIENAIKRRMHQGLGHEVEITAMIPQPHSGAWMSGDTNETVAALDQTLKDAGYEVAIYEGGTRGRGYIKVSW
jgi:hypothetical protein